MSRLTYCEYRGLEGKVITSIRWSNQEDFKCLTITFEDETICMFRVRLTVDEELELADFKDGNISNERALTAIPIRAQVKPLDE